MSADEFQSCLDTAGLTQSSYADLIDVAQITVRKRKGNPDGIPMESRILLRLLRDNPKLLPQAWAAAGLPDGRESRPPGGQPKDEKVLERIKKQRAKESLGKKVRKAEKI